MSLLWLVGGLVHLITSMSFLVWLKTDVERLRQRIYQRGGHDIGHIVTVLDELLNVWAVAIAFLVPFFGVWVVQSRWREWRDATIDRLQLNQPIPGDEPTRRWPS